MAMIVYILNISINMYSILGLMYVFIMLTVGGGLCRISYWCFNL